ncbi:DotA/TraY family protein [Escherichia coli]
MKIIPRALSAGLALAAVPAQAFVTYQDIVSAATNPDDLSRQALVTIFGDVVTNPLTASSNTIIGNLFMVFNAIIAIMGIVWFLFIGIRHVVRTGHQGNVFNNGRDIVGMLSIVSGFMMIVPTASGWSLAQLVMLWGASIMGIGSANIMVQTAAENIAEGYSMTVQPVHVSTHTAARGILEMALCKHAMNAGLDDFNRTARSSTPPMSESSRTENGRYTVTVSNGSATCGSVSLTVKGNGSNNQSALDYFFNPFIETEYQGVLTAQRSAMDTMLRDLDSAAQEFVSAYRTRRDTGNGNLPDIESRIQKALPTDNAETERREQLKSYLTTYGWVALGAWYQTFATANQRLAELADRAPTVSGVSSQGEAGDAEFLKEVKGAYQAQLQNSPYTPALGTTASSTEYRTAEAAEPKSIIMKVWSGVNFADKIATSLSGTGTTSDQLNPLIKMKNIGDYTMVTTETIWAGYTTVRVLSTAGSNSIFGRLVNAVSGLSDAAKAFLEAAAPPLYFLLFLLFCAGFSLSIYLPFIPFIFWMTGIGNWIVSVLIGCAASPLWAATHLGTSQDRGSRAAYGYIYLIDSMIRPLLMVFGFFFASVAIVAGGTILNALFGAALVNVQADSLTGLFSIAGFLMIYARACTTLVAAVFALQAYLPDHVINFLGGRDGVNMLGNMVSSVKDIIAGGNTNIRRTPGVREEKLKNINGDDKDGIKQ